MFEAVTPVSVVLRSAEVMVMVSPVKTPTGVAATVMALTVRLYVAVVGIPRTIGHSDGDCRAVPLWLAARVKPSVAVPVVG